MAFLLLALSVAPCADAENAEVHGDTAMERPCDHLNCSDIHADGEGEHHDSCSPLCICTCCHSLMTTRDTLGISKYPIGSNELPIIYRTSRSRLHSIEIFQPPKF